VLKQRITVPSVKKGPERRSAKIYAAVRKGVDRRQFIVKRRGAEDRTRLKKNREEGASAAGRGGQESLGVSCMWSERLQKVIRGKVVTRIEEKENRARFKLARSRGDRGGVTASGGKSKRRARRSSRVLRVHEARPYVQGPPCFKGKRRASGKEESTHQDLVQKGGDSPEIDRSRSVDYERTKRTAFLILKKPPARRKRALLARAAGGKSSRSSKRREDPPFELR